MENQDNQNTTIRPVDVPPKSSSLLSPGFTFPELSGWLAFGIPLLCLGMWIVEATSYIWRPLAIILYFALLLLGMLFVFFGNYSLESTKKFDTFEMDLTITIIGGIAILVSFSQISRHLSYFWGGFVSNQIGYWHWLRFGFSNLLESLLFDVPAIYEWNITEIKAVSTWSRTLILLFRTSIEFLVVSMIIRQFKFAWGNRANTEKKSPQSYFGLILPKTGEVILLILWGLPISIGIGGIINDGLAFSSTWAVIKVVFPFLIGVWLTWHSLKALGIAGKFNKLLAVAGIYGGILLIKEYWSIIQLLLGR